MKKLFLLALVICALAPKGYATLYVDRDESIVGWLSQGAPKQGEFNIVDHGFVAGGSETVIAAAFVFTFIDVGNNVDNVRIDLSQEDMVFHTTLFRTISIFGGLLNCDALLQLNKEGHITYELLLTEGSPLYVMEGVLMAATGDNYSAVPDGGATVGLLGVGLLGLAWLQRRVAASKAR